MKIQPKGPASAMRDASVADTPTCAPPQRGRASGSAADERTRMIEDIKRRRFRDAAPSLRKLFEDAAGKPGLIARSPERRSCAMAFAAVGAKIAETEAHLERALRSEAAPENAGGGLDALYRRKAVLQSLLEAMNRDPNHLIMEAIIAADALVEPGSPPEPSAIDVSLTNAGSERPIAAITACGQTWKGEDMTDEADTPHDRKAVEPLLDACRWTAKRLGADLSELRASTLGLDARNAGTMARLDEARRLVGDLLDQLEVSGASGGKAKAAARADDAERRHQETIDRLTGELTEMKRRANDVRKQNERLEALHRASERAIDDAIEQIATGGDPTVSASGIIEIARARYENAGDRDASGSAPRSGKAQAEESLRRAEKAVETLVSREASARQDRHRARMMHNEIASASTIYNRFSDL